MLKYIRGCALFYGIVLALVFGIGFIGAWLRGLELLVIVIGLALVGIFLLGSLICFRLGAGMALRAKVMSDRILAVMAAPAMVGVIIALAYPSLESGQFFGTRACLLFNLRHYEAIIARERQGHATSLIGSSYQEDAGVQYFVDKGPPLRVGFNPDGLLNNWSATVFDPTGQVMLSNKFDSAKGRSAAPERITKLFGGDLMGCRHLWGSYYKCAFT